MIFVFVLVATMVPWTASKLSTKVDKYQTFTFPHSIKISDEQIIIKDMSTFVRNNSARVSSNLRSFGNKIALRNEPWYYDATDSRKYHGKQFDLMKQSIYTTQNRLVHVERYLDKYEHDQSFRVGYIFTKLNQLLEDMRRIYSYAVKKYDYKRIIDNIVFYKHLTKKNIDITYIIEFLNEYHTANMKKFESFYSQLPGSRK